MRISGCPSIRLSCRWRCPAGAIRSCPAHTPRRRLVTARGVRSGLREGPHQWQGRLLCHPPRGLADTIASATTRCAPYSVKPSRISARDPSAAYPLPQATCAAGNRVRPRRERHRHAAGNESIPGIPRLPFYGRPESVAPVPPVIAEECGQELILDLLVGTWAFHR